MPTRQEGFELPDAIPPNRTPVERERNLRESRGRTREPEEAGEVELFAMGKRNASRGSKQRHRKAGAHMQCPVEDLTDHAQVDGLRQQRMIGYQTMSVARLAGFHGRGQTQESVGVFLEKVRGKKWTRSHNQTDQSESDRHPVNRMAPHYSDPGKT